jgi:hypothetical protein
VADPVTRQEPAATRTVRVVCTDRSHDGRTAKIQTFAWVEADAVGQPIQEWQPVGELKWLRSGDEKALGTRPELPCPLCGLKVSVRLATLQPIFDKLADGGVSQVELVTLAHILGGGASGRAQP